MNLGRFLFKQTSLNYSRIVSRNFNKKTQKFDYKKVVKVNKQANRKPRLYLILREDVENLGSVGQMVQVKRGYGRNHLIPNRLAVYATEENKDKYLVTSDEQSKGTTVADPKILSFINGACLEITIKAGMNSWEITQHHIAVECRKQLDIVVPAHCVEISDPICCYGDYMVGVVVNQNVTTMLKCSIVPQSGQQDL